MTVRTLKETQEDNTFIKSLYQDIERYKARNNLLVKAVIEYCQEFDSNLFKYLEYIVNYIRIQKELKSKEPLT